MPYKNVEQKREADRQAKAKARAEQKEGQIEQKKPDKRVRAWTFILYPESAVENWRDKLNELHIPYACSPLHDRDINPTGEPKKAHYHILFSFAGKKSYTQVAEITKSLGATVPKVCQDQKGLIRYMTHRDNPEKAQYDIKDITVGCGFDLAEYLLPTTSESLALQDEMVEWCLDNQVTEFWILKMYAIRHRQDWSLELSRSCFQITQFLKSLRHGADAKTYNEETGEQFF